MGVMDVVFGKVRAFDPFFTFVRATEGVSRHENLQAMLQHIASRRENDVPVPDAPFYRYGSHVAVLVEDGGSYYCCTYINGERHEVYDMQTEGEAVRAFFEEAEGSLTVLDNMHYGEFKPQYEVLERFVNGMVSVSTAFEQRRREIREYENEVQEVYSFLSDRSPDDPDALYSQSLESVKRHLRVMRSLAEDIRNNSQRELLLCYRSLDDPTVNLFGLYVFAMWYGLSRGRFVRGRSRIMSVMYRSVLQEMHTFIRENEGIAERYCDAMQYPASERAMLMSTLEDEGLCGDKWFRIGDEYFG